MVAIVQKAFLVRLIRVFFLLPIEVEGSSTTRDNYYFESRKIPLIKGLPEHLEVLVEKFKRFSRILVKTLSLQQMKDILIEYFVVDILGSIKEFGHSIKTLFCNLYDEYKELKSEGLVSYISRKINKLKKIPSYIKNTISSFVEKVKSMSKKEIAFFAVKLLVFIASAYCGYSIPDLDISLFGIGSHRHFFTHSFLPALGIALIGKFVKRFTLHMKKNCEEGDKDIVNGLNEVDNFMDIITSGVAVGISIHLSQDLFIDGSQTIRGPWDRSSIPDVLRKNYRFDDGYLLVNQGFGYKLGLRS